MNSEKLSKIVMDNMPSHDGSRSRVEEKIDGVRVLYNREYGNKWGWTGWSADYVEVDGQSVEVSPAWVNYRK